MLNFEALSVKRVIKTDGVWGTCYCKFNLCISLFQSPFQNRTNGNLIRFYYHNNGKIDCHRPVQCLSHSPAYRTEHKMALTDVIVVNL